MSVPGDCPAGDASRASTPAQVLFDGLDLRILAHVTLVTGAGFLFLVWFWQRALRSYSSASS